MISKTLLKKRAFKITAILVLLIMATGLNFGVKEVNAAVITGVMDFNSGMGVLDKLNGLVFSGSDGLADFSYDTSLGGVPSVIVCDNDGFPGGLVLGTIEGESGASFKMNSVYIASNVGTGDVTFSGYQTGNETAVWTKTIAISNSFQICTFDSAEYINKLTIESPRAYIFIDNLDVTGGVVNTAPSITSGASADFEENGTSKVYTATGTDQENNTISWSISGTDSALFNINSSTGELTFNNPPDYEWPKDNGENNIYDLSIKASDGSLSATQAVSVTVTDINESPTNFSITSASINSISTGSNATVGTLSSTDPDSGDTFTYTIVTGTGDTDNAKFNISGSQLRTNSKLGVNNYSIRIRTTDAGEATFEKAISISVTNADSKSLNSDLTDSNVDNDIEITFGADADFAGKITGVSYNGHNLEASQYEVDTTNNNKITLKPGIDTLDAVKNSYLRTPSTGNVVITATGYNDSTVEQKIEAGFVTSLEVTTQPVVGAGSGDNFSIQPVITLKDKYGNICSDGPSATANVVATALSGTGSWTIGGLGTTKTASSGVATYTDLKCTLTSPGTGAITFTTGTVSINSNEFTIPSISGKTLTADTTNNNVDNDIEITFGADAGFTGKITGVSFNGHNLDTSQYEVDSTNNNKIILKPGIDTLDTTKNAYLRTPSTGNVVITATGYNNSTVEQKIEAGSVTSLEVTTQPVVGAVSGDNFSTQPVITLKDKYGNICSDGPSATADVVATALSGTGSWTIGGLGTTKTASSGVATFTDLKCTLTSPGTGAITFTTGTVSINSNEFTIPTISGKTLTADTTNNNVDNDIEITFGADADFAGKITGVSYNGHNLEASQYEVDTTNNNKITLKPGIDTGDAVKNAYLRTPSTGNVVIIATGYNDSTVEQKIEAGSVASLEVTTQPVVGAGSGDNFSTQPVIILKDKYGNTCSNGPSATADVVATALSKTGSWTIGGLGTTKTASSGVVTFTDLKCTLTSPGTGAIKFTSGTVSINSNEFTIPTISGKTLTADTTNNNVGNNIEITFGADADFENAVTAVSFKGTTLTKTTDYVVSSGKITLKPSGGNTVLQTPATGNVIIIATGYNDSTVEQKIEAGSVASLEVTTQPVVGAGSGDNFSTQPVITLKDKYGNICSSGPSATADVAATASSRTGSWTIGGLGATKSASSGVATFTDLKCTLTAPGTGAITFTAGAVSTNSNEFTIPSISGKTLTADTTNNNVDNNIEITFGADSDFENAVTAVSFKETTLTKTTDYVVSSGKITLKPSGGNTILQTPATGNVVVTATGYNNSTVEETIKHGAIKYIGKIQDIEAPSTNGGQFAKQPIVALKDQYGNICTGDNSTQVIASKKDAGVWTLTGSMSKTAANGLVTFTDLGATNTAQIQNAQIEFNAAGLIGLNSNTVTLPSPAKSSSGSNVVASPTQPTGVEILVNGKVETAATSTTTKVEEKTVETVTLDNNKIEEKLKEKGSNTIVTIPAQKDSDVVIGQLTGQTVKNMENKDAILEIKIANVNYTLPATEINIDNISEQIGKQIELKDILVNVKISKPADETVKIIENTANKNNYQVVIKPVDFEITCTSGKKTVEISKFNSYIERMIAIPDGIDPSKITTGIVLNNDGTFTHVPTVITHINGKYYAKINSLTNSTYSVIWNSTTFADVSNHWAKEAINDMGSRLVIKGVGQNNFEPDRDITRAEYAAIVVNGLGLMRQGTGKDVFNDVASTSWYYDAVYIANEYGLISGYGDGEFRPNDKITREQAMAIISRATKITKLNAALMDGESDKLLTTYKDSEQISAWAKESIAGCIQTGIVSGKDNQMLAPKDKITRAEVATIIRRLLQKSNLI